MDDFKRKDRIFYFKFVAYQKNRGCDYTVDLSPSTVLTYWFQWHLARKKWFWWQSYKSEAGLWGQHGQKLFFSYPVHQSLGQLASLWFPIMTCCFHSSGTTSPGTWSRCWIISSRLSLSTKGWTRWTSEVSSNPGCYMITRGTEVRKLRSLSHTENHGLKEDKGPNAIVHKFSCSQYALL